MNAYLICVVMLFHIWEFIPVIMLKLFLINENDADELVQNDEGISLLFC